MRFIFFLGFHLSVVVTENLSTREQIEIINSKAKSWYKDDVSSQREKFQPSKAYDGDYQTYYSVKDGDVTGNFLNLYLPGERTIFEVKITNRLDTCCSNRIKATAVYVFLNSDHDVEQEAGLCGKIEDSTKGDNNKQNQEAQTYTLNCGGKVGNMVKLTDEDNWGHGISEVKVFGLQTVEFEDVSLSSVYENHIATQAIDGNWNNVAHSVCTDAGPEPSVDVWWRGSFEELSCIDSVIVVPNTFGETEGEVSVNELRMDGAEIYVIDSKLSTKYSCGHITADDYLSKDLNEKTYKYHRISCQSSRACGDVLELRKKDPSANDKKWACIHAKEIIAYKKTRNDCLPGQFVDRIYCLPCPKSTYSEGGGVTSCTDCPDGRTVGEGKGTDKSACQRKRCDVSSCTRDWVHDKDRPIYFYLDAGEQIVSSGGNVQLRMEDSGNLVMKCNENEAWSSKTGGMNVKGILSIFASGNLVIKSADNDPALWTSGTGGHSNGIKLEALEDRVVLYDLQSGESIWAILCGFPSSCEQNQCTQNGHNVKLQTDEDLTSSDGVIKLKVKEDGNLVVHCIRKQIRLTEVEKKDVVDPYLLIQTDGNMVVYNLNGDPVWNSKTNGVNRGTKLELTNRGNLILSELDGDKVIWESGKFCTGKNFKHFRNLLC